MMKLVLRNGHNYLTKTNAILLLLLSLFILTIGNGSTFLWISFTLAMFSSIGNDSIQTLGTFLTSNSKIPWWKLGIYIGGIFVIVITAGWLFSNGEIHFSRLDLIPHENGSNVTVLRFAAPLTLIFLTIFGIPVSTTFLILSAFASLETVQLMLAKTFLGYIIAFPLACIVWFLIYKFFCTYFTKELTPASEKRWRIFQWCSTGSLWVTWLMQNTSNVAVFLPRVLSVKELILVLTIGLFAIFFILYNGGGPIQQIVNEKQDVVRVKSATFIDLCFAIILFVFTKMNSTPMGTTWVFLGLLGGREFAISYFNACTGEKSYKNAGLLISKDIVLGSIGILISLIFVYLSRLV